MPYKITISRYIKLSISTLLICILGLQATAQKLKIDGVAVVIGKNIVLDSDIDKFKQEIEIRSEGKIKISDCEMLEELMQQKLMAHHAVIDSVSVIDEEISSRVDRSIQFFTQQYGSIEKVIKSYGFNDLDDLKKELTSVQKENILIEKEQQKNYRENRCHSRRGPSILQWIERKRGTSGISCRNSISSNSYQSNSY